jgi:hypothetical protein
LALPAREGIATLASSEAAVELDAEAAAAEEKLLQLKVEAAAAAQKQRLAKLAAKWMKKEPGPSKRPPLPCVKVFRAEQSDYSSPTPYEGTLFFFGVP